MTGTEDTATQHSRLDRTLWIWTGETGVQGLKWLIALWLIGSLPFAPLVWVMLNV